MLLGLVLALPPAIALGPGRGWTFTYQLITTVAGTLLSCFWASCLALPFWIAAPFLVYFWVKPEVRRYLETGMEP